MFDLPAARAQPDLDQWRPILDWLQSVLSAAPRSAAGVPDEAEPAHARRHAAPRTRAPAAFLALDRAGAAGRARGAARARRLAGAWRRGSVTPRHDAGPLRGT